MFRTATVPPRMLRPRLSPRSDQWPRVLNKFPVCHRVSTLSTIPTQVRPPKKKGDISSIFPSLKGNASLAPLPPRFAAVKAKLLEYSAPGKLQASWDRLVAELDNAVAEIAERGSAVVPTVDFTQLRDAGEDGPFVEEVRKRGVVILKGVIDESEALEMKESVRRYIAANKGLVKAFPAKNPSVYEIYWSSAQIRARTHPRLLSAHRFLLSLFSRPPTSSGIDLDSPVIYADRLRIRPPGDSGFSLGPHVDAGSVERWEDPTYASAYGPIWRGDWERYSPFSGDGIATRERAQLDMYNGAGACSMLRLWQGWLSLSHTGPGEGTLRVFPLLKHSTAYILLRPLFSPSTSLPSLTTTVGEKETPEWLLQTNPTSYFPGSIPSFTQELNATTHPHLNLSAAMVSLPKVSPGDYVAWHCDEIHAVEPIHAGNSDSSVFYIPAVPTSPRNLEYLKRQVQTMETGGVPPDFPGAGDETEGESRWLQRGGWDDVHPLGKKQVLGWGL